MYLTSFVSELNLLYTSADFGTKMLSYQIVYGTSQNSVHLTVSFVIVFIRNIPNLPISMFLGAGNWGWENWRFRRYPTNCWILWKIPENSALWIHLPVLDPLANHFPQHHFYARWAGSFLSRPRSWARPTSGIGGMEELDNSTVIGNLLMKNFN